MRLLTTALGAGYVLLLVHMVNVAAAQYAAGIGVTVTP